MLRPGLYSSRGADPGRTLRSPFLTSRPLPRAAGPMPPEPEQHACFPVLAHFQFLVLFCFLSEVVEHPLP